MPNATMGAFTAGDARLTQQGTSRLAENEKSVTEKYTVWLPGNSNPLAKSGNTPSVSGVPKLGDKWSVDNKYICDEITWDNSFPEEYWVASVRYSVQDEEETDEQEELPEGVVLKKITYNPTSWNMDCEFDASNGVPVRNTAGDRFQDALTTQIYTTSIQIQTMEDEVDVADLALQGTINATVEKIGGVTIQPHCGLLTISIQQGDNPDYPFEVTRNIQVATNPLPAQGTIVYSDELLPTQGAPSPRSGETTRTDLGFDACVLNAGYRYRKSESNESAGAAARDDEPSEESDLERFTDDTPEGGKALAVDPQPLLKSGGKVPKADVEAGNVVWLVFQRYKEATWPQWYPKGAPRKRTVQQNTQQQGN